MSISVVNKVGGGIARGVGGGVMHAINAAIITPVDPDEWVVTLFRSLESYVKASLDTDIYEVGFSFPTATDIGRWLPLDKTLIHFEIDGINPVVLGFGDNIVDATYSDADHSVSEHEANVHIVNFDIGVWASERTGGVTARLRAYQRLNDLFVGASAYHALQSLGIELMNFTGGNFIKEEIDNIPIFRVTGMILEVKIFSRRIRVPVPYIGDVFINPQLDTFEDTVIVE